MIALTTRALSVPSILSVDMNKLENEGSDYRFGRQKRSQSVKTALVVDDDKSVRRVFSKCLQGGGFIVDTAETGKEALDKIRDRSYDVTLIDVKLPDMNGIDLLSVMKAMSPGMTKIVITGYPTAEGGIKALEEGADAYLVKPVRREELLRVIEENLEKKRKPS